MTGPRLLLATLCIVLMLAVVAAASGPTIVASPNPVRSGRVVTIHGVVPGCPARSQVTLISQAFVHTHDFAGLPAVFATVRAHSAYSVSTRLPAHHRGNYTIAGRCGGGNLGVTAVLRVH
jgi:hypothetical protein